MGRPLVTLPQVLAELENIDRLPEYDVAAKAGRLASLRLLVDREVLRQTMLPPHLPPCAAGICCCSRGEP